MIEVRKTTEGLKLFIDTILFPEVNVIDGNPPYSITMEDNNTREKLASITFSDFASAKINTIRLAGWCKWANLKNHIFISDFEGDDEKIAVNFTMIPDLENWKSPYSFRIASENFK